MGTREGRKWMCLVYHPKLRTPRTTALLNQTSEENHTDHTSSESLIGEARKQRPRKASDLPMCPISWSVGSQDKSRVLPHRQCLEAKTMRVPGGVFLIRKSDKASNKDSYMPLALAEQ